MRESLKNHDDCFLWLIDIAYYKPAITFNFYFGIWISKSHTFYWSLYFTLWRQPWSEIYFRKSPFFLYWQIKTLTYFCSDCFLLPWITEMLMQPHTMRDNWYQSGGCRWMGDEASPRMWLAMGLWCPASGVLNILILWLVVCRPIIWILCWHLHISYGCLEYYRDRFQSCSHFWVRVVAVNVLENPVIFWILLTVGDPVCSLSFQNSLLDNSVVVSFTPGWRSVPKLQCKNDYALRNNRSGFNFLYGTCLPASSSSVINLFPEMSPQFLGFAFHSHTCSEMPLYPYCHLQHRGGSTFTCIFLWSQNGWSCICLLQADLQVCSYSTNMGLLAESSNLHLNLLTLSVVGQWIQWHVSHWPHWMGNKKCSR